MKYIEKINATIVEKLINKYVVKADYNNEVFLCDISGNVKKNNKILVGDKVTIRKAYDTWIIDNIHNRKNEIIRPPVANIDQMLLVASIDNPKPDYLLLDSEIVLCLSLGIKPVIVITKLDTIDYDQNNLEYNYIKNTYEKLGITVKYVSIFEQKSINEIKLLLENKITALSGNSGVGKSSLTKKILDDIDKYNDINIEVGKLATKLNKGKHTTKYVRLYTLSDNTYLLDTPGFSSYELYDLDYRELKLYYNEFSEYKCKYLDCNHINENLKECKIKEMVQEEKIDSGRYERYKYIFLKLKENYDKKY